MGLSICIIGGGAAGMVAAIEASRKKADVFVLEQKEQLGKKILSTGNGRCNLTNTEMSDVYFRGENPQFFRDVLVQFSVVQTRKYFKELGLLTKERDTYIYPRTGQASSVRDVLLQTLRQQKIAIHTGISVTNITKKEHQFVIETADKKASFKADRVILATGGKAAEILGSDGSGYALAHSFGHRIVPVVPALVQLKAAGTFLKQLAGVRTDAKVSLFIDGTYVASDTGEVQWTAYGISGIPVFQISRFAAYGLDQNRGVEVSVDIFFDMNETDILEILIKKKRDFPECKIEDVLAGMMHKKLIPVLCMASGVRLRSRMKDVTEPQCLQLSRKCKHFLLSITGTMGFANAQVCAGGICTAEIDETSMESKLESGLYIVGELLDVDGMCGGYNLQWAWTTGYLAGSHAGTRRE